jgi:hypothetical protein
MLLQSAGIVTWVNCHYSCRERHIPKSSGTPHHGRLLLLLHDAAQLAVELMAESAKHISAYQKSTEPP